MRIIRVIIFLIFSCGGVLPASAQEVRARVSGLETDSTYMSLLTEEFQLKSREDSLMGRIRQERERFATDTTNFRVRSQNILLMEESIFDVRRELGILASKINHIEQDFILSNLSNPGSSSLQTANTPSSNYPNLIDNDYFRQNLSAEEYRDLKGADQRKSELKKMALDFRASYTRLKEIERAYEHVVLQAPADSIYTAYQKELVTLGRLERSFKSEWDELYNQEIYTYSYLLDKLNRMTDLAELNEKSINRRIDTDGLMSEVFAEYPFQKDVLIDYELALAEALKLSAAKDSLINARRRLVNENLAFPEIKLAEKEFVRYEFVSFPEVSPYDKDNPIPLLEIPESGTYYSVTVGTFSQRQPVSIFRGAAPVYYERLRTGQWRYYVGIFRSYGDALDGVQELKDGGFRRPEAVRWNNRVFENLAAQSAKSAGLYRIALRGQHDLSEDIRFVLNRYARTKEVTRVGNVFYVGTFTDKIHADDVVRALDSIEGLETEIEEITG